MVSLDTMNNGVRAPHRVSQALSCEVGFSYAQLYRVFEVIQNKPLPLKALKARKMLKVQLLSVSDLDKCVSEPLGR